MPEIASPNSNTNRDSTGGFRRLVLALRGVDWLAQPILQIWHKIVSAVLHELFQLCFSRCVGFTTLLKDRQQSLFEEHVCQAHVSLVASNRHLQLTN
jgi:hypothetical protein